jgi:hypothetical protein
MFKAEKQDSRELRLEGLTQVEQQVLDSLTEKDVELVKRLRLGNLTKEKARIVGVRSEDLLFLLESIQRGFIPAEIETDPGKYYVAANPESTFILANQPEAIESSHSKTFGDLTRREIEFAGTFDVVQHAVERNLLSGGSAKEKLLKELRHFYRGLKYNADELNLKEFYRDVAEDLTVNPGVLRFHSRSRPALALLSRHIEEALPPDAARNFLQSLTIRKGVVLAFNEKLLANYRFLHADHADMVIHIPTGKVGLDTLLGFETLGDFEDSVLEKIGASENDS